MQIASCYEICALLHLHWCIAYVLYFIHNIICLCYIYTHILHVYWIIDVVGVLQNKMAVGDLGIKLICTFVYSTQPLLNAVNKVGKY